MSSGTIRFAVLELSSNSYFLKKANIGSICYNTLTANQDGNTHSFECEICPKKVDDGEGVYYANRNVFTGIR